MKLIAIIAASVAAFTGGVAVAQTEAPPTDPNLELAQKLRDQLFKERKQNHVKVRRAYRAGMARAMRRVVNTPDARVALQVAGAAYGQSWQQMRSCWLSEGYRLAERFQRRITRDNRQGSGATGPAQFMPSTFRSTPFGHLDIHNVVAQAMATGWMWANGRRGEWAGAGC